jgi:hypothetical protein
MLSKFWSEVQFNYMVVVIDTKDECWAWHAYGIAGCRNKHLALTPRSIIQYSAEHVFLATMFCPIAQTYNFNKKDKFWLDSIQPKIVYSIMGN